jgi:hypothetical protein
VIKCKRFLLIYCAVSVFCGFFCSYCFASDLDKVYPWYFYPNEVKKGWKIAKEKGDGVVVDVLDSKIHFISILKGKEYLSSNSTLYETVPEHLSSDQMYFSASFNIPVVARTEMADLHGTAITGLIVGELDRLICEEASKESCDKDGRIAVAGIAPKAKILDRTFYFADRSQGDLYNVLLDSVDEKINNDPYDGQPNRRVARRTKLILINISGGSDDNTLAELIERKASTKKGGDGNPYFLIIAAVGNDGVKLTGKKICSQGIMPAKLSRIFFTGKEMRDPIIRVGGISTYASAEEIQIFHYPPNALLDKGSNWGEECVDILAPGEAIPVLKPPGEAKISSGTSDSAAIVSGTVALLSSCNPFADADNIRQALLSNSDTYDHLKDKVKDGRVLNIYEIVKNYCRKPLSGRAFPINNQNTQQTNDGNIDDVHDEL